MSTTSTPVKAAAPPRPPHPSPLQATVPDRALSPERETPRKIIARSKEILMVNLSLQTVQDEIQSLRDKTKEMEAALDQRRLEMGNEAKKLNVELTKSDDNAATAVKEAERMKKLRLQKTKELQELKQQLKLQVAVRIHGQR